MSALDTHTARRLARELIDAAIVGDPPSVTLMQLDLTDPEQLVDVVQALVHHGRGLVLILADSWGVTTGVILDHMAEQDSTDR